MFAAHTGRPGAEELGQGRLEQGRGDVGKRIVGINGTLQVIAGCGGSEDKGAGVDFGAGLQLVDAFGGFAHTDQQQPRGKGVQRAGVANLEFLQVEGATNGRLDFVDGLKRGPLAGLVDGNDNALEQFVLSH